MFLSYEYQKSLGHDNKTNEYRYQYKILDTDFGGVVVVVGAAIGLGVLRTKVAVAVAVIDTYEKRNLPVAANLTKAISYVAKEYDYPVNRIIENNKKYNPKFAKYEKDIEKYLVLI